MKPMLLIPSGVHLSSWIRTTIGTKKRLKFYLKWLIITLHGFGVSTISILYSLTHPFDPYVCVYWGKMLRTTLMPVIGLKYRILNQHNMLPKGQSAIMVFNHQAFIDNWNLLLLCDIFDEPIVGSAKKKYFWYWPLGLALWLADVTFFDNSPGNEKGREMFNKACERRINLKQKIYVTPEGTRNKNPHKLLPFRKGAFRMAIIHQIPIIPVAVAPYDFYDPKELKFDSGQTVIDIMEPVYTTGLTLNDVDQLRDEVYEKMRAKIEKPPISKL